jgi:hypothetical protein
MFIIFFGLGIAISGSLAVAGIKNQSLQFSKTKTITGTPAKTIGFVCLGLCLIMSACVAWLVIQMFR